MSTYGYYYGLKLSQYAFRKPETPPTVNGCVTAEKKPTLIDVDRYDIIENIGTAKKFSVKKVFINKDSKVTLLLIECEGDRKEIEILFDELNVESWKVIEKFNHNYYPF
jgi:hypothetical protein